MSMRQTSGRARLVAVSLGAFVLLYLSWQALHWGPWRHELAANILGVPLPVIAAYAAWRASRRAAGYPRLRSAWRWVAWALAAQAAGDISLLVYENVLHQAPYPSVSDLLYLSFYPLLFVGVMRFPTASRSGRQVAELILDCGIVALGGAAVFVYLTIGPNFLADQAALPTITSVAYPVGDLILLVALATALLRGAPSESRRPLVMMALAMTLFVVADMIYGYLVLHGTYSVDEPLSIMYMFAFVCFIIAANMQPAGVRAPEQVAAGGTGARWLPYIGVTAIMATMVTVQYNRPWFPDRSITIIVLVSGMLVVLRQLVYQRDLIDTQGQLSYRSLHDTLTDLPNRALVIDRAEQMLARARRVPVPVAALYVDIDGFKQVNDSLGHAAGDELLRAVAARLSDTIRGADTVGRLGGDEFVVLLENYALDVGPEMVAERICEVIAQPIELGQDERRTLNVTVSVGIAIGQRACADEMLRDADFALYEAKAAGKNRWLVFESKMQTLVQDRLELEMDLHDALERDEFFLLYQPTFDLQSETMTGVEALLRWRHPTRGIVSPETFIPLAEETGLIVPIGRWVLRTACAQGAIWHDAGQSLSVAVNVSARQLDYEHLVRDVTDALNKAGLAPSGLTLEITETTLMRDSGASTRRLRELKELGVRIAIDDFGTGYSSLAYLRQFPVDALKIDRSFIAGIARSHESKALIHTLVQLGKTLGLETLGEGIEQEAQLRLLQREQCDTGQGFLFARPLASDAIDEMLASATAA